MIEDRDEATNHVDQVERKYKIMKVERDALQNEAKGIQSTFKTMEKQMKKSINEVDEIKAINVIIL